MKMTQISDTTLKITISMNDLEERGMELADFLMPQEKTEDFFYAVLDELDLPETFRHSGLLSFRVTPKPDKVDIFVTKSEVGPDFQMDDLAQFEEFSKLSPEEFFKNLEASMKSKSDQEAQERLEQAEAQSEEERPEEYLDYIHYVLKFDTMAEVVAFAKVVDYPTEASEIYKYHGHYYVTLLLHVENKPKAYPNHVYARILEHAKESQKTRAFLREHAHLLREGEPLKELAGLQGASV